MLPVVEIDAILNAASKEVFIQVQKNFEWLHNMPNGDCSTHSD